MAIKVSNKKPLFGNTRSHANNASRHAQKVNRTKITVNGVKIITSAREARTMKKGA